MNKNIIDYIKNKWDCVSYARLVLGLPIYKSGDRCKSFRPDAKNPTSLLVENNHWCDFGNDTRGDVIDLCAIARHNGDKGEAVRELGGDQLGDFSGWKNYTQNLTQKINIWHQALRQSDRDYLASRRISPETAERLSLGYSAKEQRLTIPYTKNGHFCYVAGRDRSGRDGAAKYKKMFIDNFNEHVPWGLHTLSKDFDALHPEPLISASDGSMINRRNLLVVAEGAFDAISFEQEGFHVLSPIGGYFSKPQLTAVLAAAKDKSCKFVFICFDSDNRGCAFQKKMAEICFSHRINFKCGHLPHGVKDVSDFYTAGGNLADLIANAQNGLAALAQNFSDKDQFADFLRSASRFVRKSDIADLCSSISQFPKDWLKALVSECVKAPSEKLIIDDLTSQHMIKFIEASGFYEYTHGVWKFQPDNVIKSYIADSLGLYATGARLSSILGHLKARLTSQEEFNTKNIFSFLNGTLDLDNNSLNEHSPADMACVQAPFCFDKNSQAPKWSAFISQIMQDDSKKIDLIQEIAGYPLFPDNSLQKCIFLMGDGSNGKSVFIDVLASVFGDDNCSTVEISSLATPFDAIRLRHSLVNFSSETKTNIKEAEAKFKAVVVGDKISSAYKGKDAVEFRPRSKWICATNSYISSNDITYGLARRILFVRFGRTFKEPDIDRDLTRKLREEKAGIFNWLYKGYLRLKKNGSFTQTDEQEILMNDFMQSINPAAIFFDEELASVSNTRMSTKDIYSAYTLWAKSSGFAPMNRNNFTRSIRAVLAQKRPDVTYNRHADGWGFDFYLPKIQGGI